MNQIELPLFAPNETEAVDETLEEILQAYHAGNKLHAEVLCENAVIRNPYNPDAWHMLGLLRNDSNDTKAAVKLICQAIDLNPANAKYYYNLGLIFDKSGERRRASESYRHALQLEPGLFSGASASREFLIDEV
jgi:protein O-GlcNAc transferase